jgi:hypothetical protein
MFHGAVVSQGWNCARRECVEPPDVMVAGM